MSYRYARWGMLMLFWICWGPLAAQQDTSWISKTAMPEGRHHPVTWNLGDTGYVVTGTNTRGQFTNDFYSYDPGRDRWQVRSSFPGAARSFAIGEEYGGKGYMGFGASNFGYFNDLWEYDPAADAWTQLPPCPCSGRRHPALIIQKGRLFVGMGDNATGNLNDWWEYDIQQQTWTQRDDFPGARRHHPYQFKAGEHVYAGLGHGNRNPIIYKDWYQYNLDSNKWFKMNDFPGEARVAGTQFDRGGKGYVLSGDGDNHSFMQRGEFWEYDPFNDTWTELPPHPGISKWAPGSFLLRDTLYFLAGQNRRQNVNTDENWAYTFSTPVGFSAPVAQAETGGLYPNPARDQLYIRGISGQAEVTVYDLQGRRMLEEVLRERASLDISRLPAGMYLVEWRNAQASIQRQRMLVRD